MATLRVADLEIHYEQTGSGPPLVLLHGGFVDMKMWEPQVAALAGSYRILRYDLRGHGLTGPSRENRYTVEHFAEDLRGLLDGLGLERVALCGLSLGGMIAQAFAARYPERLRALVLADTVVSTTHTLSDKLQTHLLAPGWAVRPTIRHLGADRWVRLSFWLASKSRSDKWFGQDEATSTYVKKAMSQLTTAEYVKVYGALYAFREQALSNVRVPTLLLNGEYEPANIVRHAERLKTLLPQATSATIPRAGHTSNMENPTAFNALLQSFLETC